MVGLFNWIYSDVLFTFNFEPDRKLSLSQGHKYLTLSAQLATSVDMYGERGWRPLSTFTV